MSSAPIQAIRLGSPKTGLIGKAVRLISRPYSFRLKYYLVAITVVLTVTLVQKVIALIPTGPTPAILLTDKDAAAAQLNALYNMDNLITTLATALLGGLGYFLANRGMKKHLQAEMRLVVAIAGCAALSLFLGYVLYLGLLDMSGKEVCVPGVLGIAWVRGTQFYSFLLAVVLFGDLAFQAVKVEDGHEENHSPAGN
jgi:hypothetical protein